MEAVITQLTEIDYVDVIIALLIIIGGFKAIITLLEWFASKIGIEFSWIRKRKEQDELLKNTADALIELKDRQENDAKESLMHDREIMEKLSGFMDDMKNSIEGISKEQRELIKAVDDIAKRNVIRDECTIEEMCDRITQKTRHYINELHGIPEDEYDDFVRLFKSYSKLGGNHGAKAKYDYCINNLPILPVETKIQSVSE